ncbi:hypothetical protein FRB93_002707 [Tulasnella sp. JGI-2019a]|nr:hypothetical protein FRB93_002707 [Tulasnella sp. JGI-2019a]
MCEYVVVERDELIEVPQHLSFEQAAAWPCAGITAYRAVFVKGLVASGQNVLITGIGGGVALTALQLCVAAGANVYVTSSSEEKIKRAVDEFGAKGGVNYKNQDWPKELYALLKEKVASNGGGGSNSSDLDVIIDQAGGDICGKTIRMLRLGAIIVCFGMHAERMIPFTMPNVLKNIELKGTRYISELANLISTQLPPASAFRPHFLSLTIPPSTISSFPLFSTPVGSTMGSQAELVEATNFIAKHKIIPQISHILDGLDDAERGFELLEDGSSMGKIVVRITPKDAKL